jgi:hypothetical protein
LSFLIKHNKIPQLYYSGAATWKYLLHLFTRNYKVWQ